jgi:hypothetical protein
LEKPGNEKYFRDEENTERVRKWQKGHPGYWKNTTRWRKRTLQDACWEQVPLRLEVAPGSATRTLQDLCSMQTPLFVGLIAMLAGSTLQDDIATTTRQLVAEGYDILGMVPGVNFERSHEKTCLNPERLRKVPPQFSWIGHRLVQENYFTRCDHSSWALYLFLVSVADVDGLSYYSDASLMRRLKMDDTRWSKASSAKCAPRSWFGTAPHSGDGAR